MKDKIGNSQIKKGFSLIEILVVLVIIGVLIAIVAFGIGIIQRNSRDTIRKNTVKDVSLLYQDIYGNNLGTPTSLQATGQELNFFNGSTELGLQPVEVENRIIPVVVASCMDLTLPEPDDSALSICLDNVNKQVGVALESQDAIFYFPL